MPLDLRTLCLLAGSLRAVTLATVLYVGFHRLETRFTLVVTWLLEALRKPLSGSGIVKFTLGRWSKFAQE
jgi:hypothetical protein